MTSRSLANPALVRWYWSGSRSAVSRMSSTTALMSLRKEDIWVVNAATWTDRWGPTQTHDSVTRKDLKILQSEKRTPVLLSANTDNRGEPLSAIKRSYIWIPHDSKSCAGASMCLCLGLSSVGHPADDSYTPLMRWKEWNFLCSQ